MSKVFRSDPAWTDVSYVGPSVVGTALQKMNVFYPDPGRYARPADGWPTWVWHEMGGFRITSKCKTIGPYESYVNPTTPDNDGTYVDKRFLYLALSRGWAVIFNSVTVAFGDNLGNGTAPYQVVGVAGLPAADIEFVPGKATNYDYGTAPDGNGICVPRNSGVYPAGYKDSQGHTKAQGALHPYQDPLRHNCFRDSEMIAQFIGAHGHEMGLDMSRLYSAGTSAGADVACWTAYGINRAPHRWANPSGQEFLPTNIYRGSFYATWQPSMNMVSDAYSDPRGPCRVPKVGSHILSNHYDVAGYDILNVDRADLLQGDVMKYIDTPAKQKLSVTYFTDTDGYNSGNGPWVVPVPGNLTPNAGTNPHNAYGLGLWKTLLGSRCVGYLMDTGLAPVCNVAGKLAYDCTVNGFEQFHNRVLNTIETDCGMVRRASFNPRKAL